MKRSAEDPVAVTALNPDDLVRGNVKALMDLNNIVRNWMGQGNAGGYTYNSHNPPRMFGVRGTWYF